MDRSTANEQMCSTPDQYEDEELDPRVKVELDRLNKATDEINKLESALEDANNSFRHDLSECSSNLQALGRKLGSAVEKARPYFEAMLHAKKLHLDCQRTAVQYHRANAVHQAARSTISLAEERFTNPNHQSQRQFDPAWQEMLNHATRKVLEAEAGRSASEREHEKRAAAYTAAQQKAATLARQLKGPVNKARPYFEQKERFDSQMEHMSQRVNQLQRAVASAKLAYSHALRSLEQISEEIHEQRRCDASVREPGVGAEDLPEGEQVVMQDWSCVPSMEPDDKSLKTFDELASNGNLPSLSKGRSVSGSSATSAPCSESSDGPVRSCGSGDEAPVVCGASTSTTSLPEDKGEQKPQQDAKSITESTSRSTSTDCHKGSIDAALANTAHDIDRISQSAHIMVTSLSLSSYSDESLFKTNPTGAEKSLSYIDNNSDAVTDDLSSRRKQRTLLDTSQRSELTGDRKKDDSSINNVNTNSVADPSDVRLVFSEDNNKGEVVDGNEGGCENSKDCSPTKGDDSVSNRNNDEVNIKNGDTISNTKPIKVSNDSDCDNKVNDAEDSTVSKVDHCNDTKCDEVVQVLSPSMISIRCSDVSTSEIESRAVEEATLSTA